MKWVGRNKDKPHRCPECHAVRRRTHWGPRTTVVCGPCGVRWKMGRGSRYPMSEYRRHKRLDAVVEMLLRGGSLGTPRAEAVQALCPDDVVRKIHPDG